jgi:hypothetical protein
MAAATAVEMVAAMAVGTGAAAVMANSAAEQRAGAGMVNRLLSNAGILRHCVYEP